MQRAVSSIPYAFLIKTDLSLILYIYDHMQESSLQQQKGWKEVIPNVVASPWYIYRDTIWKDLYNTVSLILRRPFIIGIFIASPLRRPLPDERRGAGGRQTESAEWERSGVPDRVIGSSRSKDHSGDQ